MAGRGFGKTKAGSEYVRACVESGQYSRIALVNDTAADVRDVMIEGPDGILAVSPPWNRPIYEATKRRVTWPNGAVAIAYAAEAPGMLRGPQHDLAWGDEFTKWKNLLIRDEHGETAFSNLLLGLRMGRNPKALFTLTPRPIAILKAVLARSSTVITRGSSMDNSANLAPSFFSEVVSMYRGTRLERQEIYGELIEDLEGALWKREWIEKSRVHDPSEVPAFSRVVVAIDPAGSIKGSETGIVICGLGVDGDGYVLGDLSGHFSPDTWGQLAVGAYHAYQADAIIGEKNNGGDMVGHVVHTVSPTIPFYPVHASRGKHTRAEPIAALHQQGRIHIVGVLSQLEDQLTSWEAGDDSPDRLDAMVWGLTDLLLGEQYQEASLLSGPVLMGVRESPWKIH